MVSTSCMTTELNTPFSLCCTRTLTACRVAVLFRYVSVGLAHFPVDTFMPLYQVAIRTPF